MNSNEFPDPEPTRLQILAHDLQNCLHVIAQCLEVLKFTRHNDEKFLDTCAVIDQERRRATQLVDEMAKSEPT